MLGKVCGFKLAGQSSVVGALYRADVCIWAVCTPRRPIHPRIHCQCDQTRPWLFFAARLIDSVAIAPKSSAGILARLHACAVTGPRGCWETSGARYLGQYTPPDSVFEDVRPALPDITGSVQRAGCGHVHMTWQSRLALARGGVGGGEPGGCVR